jgi:hypothetical protein
MQYWIQPDTDTSSINSLQREIGQITGMQINYVNSPEGFMFYINEIKKNNWDWNIKSSDNKYFVSIFHNESDECYAESHNLTIALLSCYLDVLFVTEQN